MYTHVLYIHIYREGERFLLWLEVYSFMKGCWKLWGLESLKRAELGTRVQLAEQSRKAVTILGYKGSNTYILWTLRISLYVHFLLEHLDCQHCCIQVFRYVPEPPRMRGLGCRLHGLAGVLARASCMGAPWGPLCVFWHALEYGQLFVYSV